ncbi:hypothetical protein [Dokdonella sp.]|uniref:hypothetical protein n=1 Tax=Dokdonella sp. TaxID=2291710 RepID=UPI003526CDE8
MLDEYGLRLLAEIGVDVYAPRPAAGSAARVPASGQIVAADASTGQTRNRAGADVLVLGFAGKAGRMRDDLLRAFRLIGLRAELSGTADAAALDDARNLVVFGEAMARELGSGMPAQRQNAIHWIVTSEPAVLAASAAAKQGLWGEIKRLSRLLRASGTQN